MKITKDTIRDTITNSAKTRFDYKSFAGGFDFGDGKIPEKILLRVIDGLASGETKEQVARQLDLDVWQLGCGFEEHFLEKFLEHKENELKNEILVTQLARTMLEQGSQPVAVLNAVHQMLHEKKS